ncbi:MAG: hypothetical protein WBB02_03850 [Saprospiraceae bacterium]
MDNISYHGTNAKNANSIVGPPSNIKLSIGKGELGKGFYTGSSLSLAVSWAFTRYESDAHIVELNIEIDEFIKLKPLVLDKIDNVLKVWKNSKDKKINQKYDYIVAPFVTIRELGKQFKFESHKSEVTINKSGLKKYPCV